MRLSDDAPRFLHALFADGALAAEAVVDHDLVISDVSGRSPCALLSTRAGPSRFVKANDLAHLEASRFRALAPVPALARHLPTLIGEGPDGSWLLTSAADGAVDCLTHHHATADAPPEIGRALGDALGALHTAAVHVAPAPLPLALRLHRPGLDVVATLNEGAVEAIRRIQADRSLDGGLEALRERWRPAAVIHGDLKWANIVLEPRDPSEPPSLRLVDLEHTGRGEPAWDVGSALGAYLTFWLSSLRPPRTRSAAALAATARMPLSRVRPAMTALWTAYLAAADVSDVDELRDLASAHAAARLVQTALEGAGDDALGGREALHLQVAANILADPRTAAFDLLGLCEGP